MSQTIAHPALSGYFPIPVSLTDRHSRRPKQRFNEIFDNVPFLNCTADLRTMQPKEPYSIPYIITDSYKECQHAALSYHFINHSQKMFTKSNTHPIAENRYREPAWTNLCIRWFRACDSLSSFALKAFTGTSFWFYRLIIRLIAVSTGLHNSYNK